MFLCPNLSFQTWIFGCGAKNRHVVQASWRMYLKFGNCDFRCHLSLAFYPSQLHQKGSAYIPLVKELLQTPSPPSLQVSKVTSLISTRSYHSKNPYPPLPSATKSELIPSSTSQALQSFRAVNICSHTHLNLPSVVETAPVLSTLSHMSAWQEEN